ncbi:lectin-like domain-containing protein [Enterococcus sp. LJL128]
MVIKKVKPILFLFLLSTLFIFPNSGEAAALNGIADINQVKDRLIKLDNYFYPVVNGQGVVSNVTKADGYDIVNVTKRNSTYGNGAIWSEDEYRMNLNYDFSTSMWLYFGVDPSSGSKPEDKKVGDGMAFVMHADKEGKNAYAKSSKGGNVFGGGASLGVWAQANNTTSARGAITNSLAIEFDNHINKDGMDKGTTNGSDDTKPYGHVAWNYPGMASSYGRNGLLNRTLVHKDAQAVDTFGDGKWHQLSIRWDASESKLTYSFDQLGSKTISLDPQAVFGTKLVYWGFTGSTGKASMDARIVFEEFPRPIFTSITESVKNEQGQNVIDTLVTGGQKLRYSIDLEDIKGTGELKNITIDKQLDSNSLFLQEEANIQMLKNGQNIDNQVEISEGNLRFTSKQPLSLVKGDKLQLSFDVEMKESERTPEKPLEKKIDGGKTTLSAVNNVGEALSFSTHPGFFRLNSNLSPELEQLEVPDQLSIEQELEVKAYWEELNVADTGTVSFVLDDLSTSIPEDIKREEIFTTDNNGNYQGRGMIQVNFGQLPAGDYQLTVKAKDKNQLASNEIIKKVTVIGSLTLVSVPNQIDFGEIAINQIENGQKSYPRIAGNKMYVEVSDLRAANASPWVLVATVEQPLQVSGKNQLLSGKLYFSETGTGTSGDNQVDEQLLLIRQQGSFKKTWSEDEGILLQVNDTVIKGNYSAVINWTLQDGIS